MKPSRSFATETLLVLTLSFSLLLAAGCADNRTPFEVFLDCNNQIKSAADDEELLSCFTEEKRAEILAEHKNHTPDIWREQFRNQRPHEPNLFREIFSEDGEFVNILMYSGVGVYLATHTAKMERENGQWKIAEENTLGNGVGFNDRLDMPAAVSMNFTGAIEWQGSALTVSAPVLPACNLQIRHVFNYAVLQLEADCRKLRTPGEYSAEEIIKPDAESPIYVQAPDGGRLDTVKNGSFIIEALKSGRFTAAYELNTDGLDGPYVVSGRFENIPVPFE